MRRSKRRMIRLAKVMFVALSVAAATSCYSPAAMATDARAIQLNNSANQYYDQKQYERAIQDFDQAIKLDRDYKVAYYNRGNAHRALGKYERAIQDYDMAIKLDPNFKQVYSNRGLAYLALGQYETAIQDCDRAIKLDPNSNKSYSNRGLAYLVLGQYETAIQDFDQAVKLDPKYKEAYNKRGHSYYLLGQYARAIQDFDQSIKLNPNFKEPYLSRGCAYYILGQYERAIQDFDQALKLDPNYTEAYDGRGSARIELGQLELAVSDLQGALAKRSGYNRLTELAAIALCYALDGKKEDSNKCLSESMDLWENATEAQRLETASALLDAARAQVQMGELAKARDTLAKMSGSSKLLGAGEKAQMKALSGLIERSEGNRLVAEADMSEALKICSSNALVRAWSKSLSDKASIVQKARSSAVVAPANSSAQKVSSNSSSIDRPIRDKWAVVVGVSKFKDPAIPSLKYSAKDARDFYNYLITTANFKPDHVRLLTNEKATRERIFTEIGDKFLPHVVGRDDLVVLYFATHGSGAEHDVRRSNYLVAYDTPKNLLYADGIEMQKLLDQLQDRTHADRVLIVLDACHSGGADPNARALGDNSAAMDINSVSIGRGNIILSSSQPDELSWESKRYQNGVFTKQLINSLSKDPGVLSAFDKVKDVVADEVLQTFGQHQTPRLKADGWEGKELRLNLPATKPVTVSAEVKQSVGPDSKDAESLKAPPRSSAPRNH